jgi:UDP-glucuronate 4-epimerase
VTGAAGFIGMHVAKALLDAGAQVTGIDNFDPYYDVRLKEARVGTLAAEAEFTFARMDLADANATARLFGDGNFDSVVHLAAQPGVRYSLVNPAAYVRNNLVAFGHILEGCRHAHVSHLALRVVIVGLRRESNVAFFGGSAGRSSSQPVRRHEEGERADGAHL